MAQDLNRTKLRISNYTLYTGDKAMLPCQGHARESMSCETKVVPQDCGSELEPQAAQQEQKNVVPKHCCRPGHKPVRELNTFTPCSPRTMAQDLNHSYSHSLHWDFSIPHFSLDRACGSAFGDFRAVAHDRFCAQSPCSPSSAPSASLGSPRQHLLSPSSRSLT